MIRKIVKWIGIVLGGLVGLLVLAFVMTDEATLFIGWATFTLYATMSEESLS